MRLSNHTITFPKGIEDFWKSIDSQIEDIKSWVDENYDDSHDEVEIYGEIYLPLTTEYNDYKNVIRQSEKLSKLNEFEEETNTEETIAEIKNALDILNTDTKDIDTSNFKF